MGENNETTGLEIAVIGMSGRFPEARNLKEFWNNLKNGKESITFLSDEQLRESGVKPEIRDHPNYVNSQGGVLEDKAYFDASFFGYTPLEAQVMHPQVRFFYETVWEALEDAGYNPHTYGGLIGLFAGATSHIHWPLTAQLSGKSDELGSFAASSLYDKDYMSTRVSFKLNLRGPSVSMQTACSTSLVAIHQAVQSMLNGECDMALAGGVSVTVQTDGYIYQEGMIYSPDGHCRAFDAKAGGTVGGNGVGVVLLKPLEDALEDGDHIHAVIKGSAINNDGSLKAGYTAPSKRAQAEVIRTALKVAEVEPETIGYVETHGTATSLGDPIEAEALTLAYNTDKRNYCRIGSVKTNIGHLDAAAGIVGFIKTVLTLKNKQIPPSLNFEKPNPNINFADSPFEVNAALTEWKSGDTPRRAGVSSFGIGGTNAHIVLEEAPQREKETAAAPARRNSLLLLSAKTPTALDKATKNMAEHIRENPGINLADAAYTLQVGRKDLPHRRMLLTTDAKQAADDLQNQNPETVRTYAVKEGKKPVIFMFSGQGSQYQNMGKDLYRTEPRFREEMDRSFEILKNHMNIDIEEILYPSETGDGKTPPSPNPSPDINQTEITQPVLFAIEYALAKLLQQWGIKPYAMIGHSIGEYVAACLAGVFTQEDALKLVAARGWLMQQMPTGSMLSVPISEKELEPHLGDAVSVAALNGPANTVASGPHDAVAALEERLTRAGITSRRLHTSHAFHSKMMDPILEKFEEKVKQVRLNKPTIPYISNVTGKWITVGEATDPAYWATHIRSAVRFSDGLSELFKTGETVYLEVGPGKALSTLTRKHDQRKPEQQVVNLVRHKNENRPDDEYLLNKLGELWLYGVKPDWKGYYGEEKRNRIPLPTYPFERKRYWIDGDPLKAGAAMERRPRLDKKKPYGEFFHVPLWKQTPHPPCEPEENKEDNKEDNKEKNKNDANWLVFTDETGFGARQVKKLAAQNKKVNTVAKGQEYGKINDGEYRINPARPGDYRRLLEELAEQNAMPNIILHHWGVTGPDKEFPGERRGEPCVHPAFPDSHQESNSKNNSTNNENNNESNNSNNNAAELETEEKIERERNRFAEAQYSGYHSQVYLAAALGRQEIPNHLRIAVITDNMQEVTGAEKLQPEKATVQGPIKVIPQEYPGIRIIGIDIDRPEPGSRRESRLLDHLEADVLTAAPGEIIAYRNNRRYQQTQEPVTLEKNKRAAIPLRQKGVYLVTGGLGGIGRQLAGYLAEKTGARLILTGRTEFPARKDWKQHLSEHAEDEISRKIRAIQDIEANGGDVMVARADVADHRQMRELIARAEERFGPLNGVIHAAGITAGRSHQCPVESLSAEDAEEQFKPKVYGLQVLEDELKDKNIDFCLLTSSLSTELGGLGFTAYAAANAYMDAKVKEHNRHNPPVWISVDWDGWQPPEKTGETEKEKAHTPTLAITAEEGKKAFQQILDNGEESRVAVAATDLQARIDKWIRFETGSEKETGHEETVPSSQVNRFLPTPYTAPQNPEEQQIVDIWEKFLGVAPIGTTDDFFELGGDSLKAMTLVSKIHKTMKVKLPLSEFFNRPTPAKQAEYIRRQETTAYTSITPAEEKEYYPLSSAQMRLYVMQRLEPQSTAYNLSYAAVLEGNLDAVKLEDAFRKVIQRHEALRTAIREIGDDPVQQVLRDVEFNLRSLAPGDENNIRETFVRPFDLARPPFLRAGLVKTAQQSHVLVLDMHHIITDAVSFNILVSDLLRYYEGNEQPDLRLHYKDYAQWQAQQGNQKDREAYWLKKFEGTPPVLEIPTDTPRPAVQDFAGETVLFEIDARQTEQARQIARRQGASMYMFNMAIYNTMLSKITGAEDIVVGTVTKGRKHDDLNHMMGMFVNTLALRNRPEGQKTFEQFLEEVKTTTLEAFENEDYQFENLVEKVVKTRDTSRNPLFDVAFEFQNVEAEARTIPGIEMKPFDYKRNTALFDMGFSGSEGKEKIFFQVEYATKLFKKETIEKFITYYKKIHEKVVENPEITLADIEIIETEDKSEWFKKAREKEEKAFIEKNIALNQEQQAEAEEDAEFDF